MLINLPGILAPPTCPWWSFQASPLAFGLVLNSWGKEPCFLGQQNPGAPHFPPQFDDFLSLKWPFWTHEDLAFGGSELSVNLLWPEMQVVRKS